MIRIGTASWTDPTLLASGLFYPACATTPAARLQYYAHQFPLVEINSSYYALPDPQRTHKWAQGTADHFRFHAKAFRLFTGHPTPPAALPTDLRREIQSEGGRADAAFFGAPTPATARNHRVVERELERD